MSRSGEIKLEFGDGEYTFRLGVGDIKKLQERTNRGPYDLFERMRSRTFFVQEVVETIRLGLVGGGDCRTAIGTPDDARINRMIRDYVEERPLVPSVILAGTILNAALMGAPDEPLPKSKAKESKPQNSKTESSPSPQYTDGAQSSATAQPTSTQ